jgi:hypothetical protein
MVAAKSGLWQWAGCISSVPSFQMILLMFGADT